MDKGKIGDIYSLSPLQEGILFHHLYDQKTSPYFIQMCYRLKGHLQVDKIKFGFNELLKRHDVLRTAFVHLQSDRPLQIVLNEREIDFSFVDIQTTENRNQKNRFIENYKEADKKRSFNLESDVLVRVAIIQIEVEEYELIWSNHHIIIDGWCIGILIQEFFKIYNSLLNNEAVDLAQPKQFREYVRWLSKKEQTTSKDFWKNYLRGYTEVTGIPRIKPVVQETNREKKQLRLKLTKERTVEIRRISQKYNVTINTFLQCVWGILLAKYNNCNDIALGIVVSGRPSEINGVESIVGLFINTIPLRIWFAENEHFGELLRRVQRNAIDAEPHSYYPLANIQSDTFLKRDLINHIFVYENYPVHHTLEGLSYKIGEEEKVGTLKLMNEEVYAQNHYDFYVICGGENEINFNFFFNEDVYDKDQINTVISNFEYIIDRILWHNDILIDDIDLNSGFESLKPVEVNAENPSLPNDILTTWKMQANLHPNKLAVCDEEKSYTYKELDQASDLLASHLRSTYKIERNEIVGLIVHPSPIMIIGVLGILKAGGAFLPLDPLAPKEHVRYALDDAQVRLVLTESTQVFDLIDVYNGKLFAIDLQLDSLTEQAIKSATAIKSSELAYTIYTSGTTGNSKGVLITRSSLSNYTNWLISRFSLAPADSTVLLSSYAFDLGYTSLWGSLLSGASLHLVSTDKIKNGEAVIDYLIKFRITFLKLTPSLFYTIVHSLDFDKLKNSSLRLILLGGEEIRVDDIKRFIEIRPDTMFVNHYGPTECTIGAVFKIIDTKALDSYAQLPVIGNPISNMQAFVLDKKMNRVPKGVTGDLYLCGAGVGEGYTDITKTKAAFLSHPLGNIRLYKTGDLARFVWNEEIQFLGRKDHQVKVRGYRIELNEIEDALLKNENVINAVVVPTKDQAGITYLTAYYATHNKLQVPELSDALKKVLPDYMVPSHFVYLTDFPVSANGKMDKRALLKLSKNNYRHRKIIAPQNKIEEIVSQIWMDVLLIEEISTDDNFFDIGGHSLKGVQVVSRIFKTMDVKINITCIFDFPTIQSLAAEIARIQWLVSDESEDQGRHSKEITI